jgi:hypothetical protein
VHHPVALSIADRHWLNLFHWTHDNQPYSLFISKNKNSNLQAPESPSSLIEHWLNPLDVKHNAHTSTIRPIQKGWFTGKITDLSLSFFLRLCQCTDSITVERFYGLIEQYDYSKISLHVLCLVVTLLSLTVPWFMHIERFASSTCSSLNMNTKRFLHVPPHVWLIIGANRNRMPLFEAEHIAQAWRSYRKIDFAMIAILLLVAFVYLNREILRVVFHFPWDSGVNDNY